MYSSTLSLTAAQDGVGWLGLSSGLFTPEKENRYLAGFQGSVWRGAENLATIGIRSAERPARSESLHRLGYPNPHIYYIILYYIFVV
jgi:hypothetical protein